MIKRISNNITQDAAVSLLRKPYNLIFSPKEIIKVELLYMPYYVFESAIDYSNGKQEIRKVCVDCISGDYAFVKNNDLLVSSEQWQQEKTFQIDADKAMQIARKTITAAIILEKSKRTKVESINTELKFVMEYPYWCGYFQKKNKLDFEVIDAVNGVQQGAKMKPTFIKLIMQ